MNDEAAAAGVIRDLFDHAVSEGFRAETVEGASDVEINAMAAAQGVDMVPAAVREVLRILGRNAGSVLAGTVFGVRGPDADDKQGALWSLEEAAEHEIRDPAGLLVVSEAGGYSYVVIDGSDVGKPNPPLWEITESGVVTRRRESVTEWFSLLMDRVVQEKHRLAEDRAKGWPDPAGEKNYRWD
ncbi:hypothetical protein [Nocardia sp. NPDC052316]|uniref:hypothetical protein n=1 Tax=Nocardia sp. NPDC052316 TaxID=3364329 RepID=UPI0037C6516C